MSEYESLREDIESFAGHVARSNDLAVTHMLEQSRQIDRLWTDNAELRDEINAVSNRLENLTRAVVTSPAEVAAKIVTDANRSTLREVNGGDAS